MPSRLSILFVAVVLVAAGGCGSSRKQPAATGADRGTAAGQLFVWVDASPDDGVAPLTVRLNCDLLQPVQQPQFFWDFDDGSGAAREQNPLHTFRGPGRYRPRVVVTDAAGNRGDDETIVDVESPD